MALLGRITTLVIEKSVYGGLGLGFLEKKAVMVPFAIPGDTLKVKITDEKKDYCIGAMESCISAGISRIIPECPSFGQCGGCAYHHIPYSDELVIKKRILEDNLIRIGGFSSDSIPEIDIVYNKRYGYRSHADFKISGGRPGFYHKGSNNHIPLPSKGCMLLAEELNSHIIEPAAGLKSIRVAIDSSNRVLNSAQKDAVVIEQVGGFTFERGINEFFQANRLLRRAMLERTAEYAALSMDETFLDIGCGVGFFTLPLAGFSSHGTGIDIRSESIRWAKRNAALNKIGNLNFIAMPASRIHPARHRADIVVADPPRSGMDRYTRKTIAAIHPQRIAYISCNPATFSRDARDIVKAGYDLTRMTLIDMFPCTHHIEVISLFKSSRTL